MPKKTRKAKIRASQRAVNPNYVPAPAAPVANAPLTPRETMIPRSGSAPSNLTARAFAPQTFDYGYVYRDLRRIGLLALLFFGLMLVLWFLVEVQGIHLIPGLL